MRNNLILGGCGFLGSTLVRRLLADPDTESVIVYDNLSSGTIAHLEEVSCDPRLKILVKDAGNLAALTEAMQLHRPDTVFHLAANPDIARAVTEPDIDFRQGTMLTQNVLEAMRVSGVKRLVYMSGSGVYGDQRDTELNEDSPCEPISTYGASKLASEAMISAYCHMFGMRAWAFRCANIVGPRQTHGVGYDFIHRLWADSTRLRILGDGKQSKSYIHVDDVVDAIFVACAAQADSYETYNVATNDYLTVDEIADMACKELWLDCANVKREYSGGARGWAGDVPVVRFDCSQIKSYGWEAKMTSREAMQAALKSMREAMEAAT